VRGASCVTCALAIEKQVKKVAGVVEVRSSLMLNEVFVDYDDSRVGLPEITAAIRRSGYSNNLARKE
jgi:P-type Cu+ transporter